MRHCWIPSQVIAASKKATKPDVLNSFIHCFKQESLQDRDIGYKIQILSSLKVICVIGFLILAEL